MRIASESTMIEVRRGAQVTVQSTQLGHAYLVKEGHLRLVRHGAGGRMIALDLMGPGDLIGVTPILTEDGDADSAEALEDVLFCRVSARTLRDVLLENPSLSLHFSKLVGLRRRTVETRLLDIAFCTVRVRIARLILDLAERFGEQTDKGVRIRLKLTHQELADMVGSNREAANRAVMALVDRGVIRFVGKHLAVSDPQALAQEAEDGWSLQSVSADTT